MAIEIYEAIKVLRQNSFSGKVPEISLAEAKQLAIEGLKFIMEMRVAGVLPPHGLLPGEKPTKPGEPFKIMETNTQGYCPRCQENTVQKFEHWTDGDQVTCTKCHITIFNNRGKTI